jgi:hypothetical protein
MARAEVHVKLTEVDTVKEMIAELTSRVERMGPVVEAARAWYANGVDPNEVYSGALSAAVEEYEAEVERWTGVA